MPGAGEVARAASRVAGAASLGRFGASPEIATPILPRPTTSGDCIDPHPISAGAHVKALATTGVLGCRVRRIVSSPKSGQRLPSQEGQTTDSQATAASPVTETVAES